MDRTDGAVGLVVPWESGPAASRRQGSGHGVGPPPTPDDGSVRSVAGVESRCGFSAGVVSWV